MKLLRLFFLLLPILWILTSPAKISAVESIDATLEKINKSSLPLGIKITPVLASPSATIKTNAGMNDTDTKPIYNSASQYTVVASLRIPTPAPSNLENFFSNLFKEVSKFFTNLVGFGNKKATQFAGTQLPQEAVNKNMGNNGQMLTQADTTDTTAMKKALPLLQCANLPLGVGDCANSNSPISSPEEGTGDGGSEVNCNQTASDISLPKIISKEELYKLALRWSPGLTDVKKNNHIRECYNDVIRKAKNAGVNPAFALMIWTNESNGSNYDISLQDFGINKKDLEGDFNKQIERFLKLPASYKANYPECFGHGLTDMEAFAYIFKTGNHCNADDPPYDPSYYNNLLPIWNWFVDDCPLPSYPTDTSCP